jgi:phospholipid N-methyltransferase
MTNEIIPEIGMDVTNYIGGDAHTATIIEIKTPKKIVIALEQNPEYNQTLTKRRDGNWCLQGDYHNYNGFYKLGIRESYWDPSF